ncbi:MAG TPA: ABC transporter permease, partial [Parachlamydiaceae bacterium]|nr:ABC transporter permease [Parachlamydiaceae bacterium]
MFELSVAYKYLIPRWRQLSVSIISLVSTLVIALVVWLIVVFFSVKDGLENSWIDKITALTAPIRITPTEKYYHSYYYLADTISSNSNYTAKTIEEKRLSPSTDPYDPYNDEEPPRGWQSPDRDSEGNLKDIVKTAFLAATSLHGIDGLKATDYETTLANLRLRLLRNIQDMDRQSQQYLEHASLIGSFDADTPSMAKALMQPNAADFNNLLQMQAISADNIKEESPKTVQTLNHANLVKRLQNFFRTVEITSLKTPVQGWRLPQKLMANTELEAVALFRDNKIINITVPAKKDKAAHLALQLQNAGLSASQIILKIDADGIVESKMPDQNFLPLAPWTTINLEGNTELPAHLVEKSIQTAKTINHLQFAISGDIQGYPLKGYAAFGQLEIAEAKTKTGAPNALIAVADKNGITMPSSSTGDPILLPKGFRDSGAHVGDQGYLAYFSPTPSTLQEQRIPVFVAGFYDPGIIPLGGKYILAGRNLTALIRASYNQEESHYS